MQSSDLMLLTNTTHSDKSVVITTKDFTLETTDQDVAVLRKGDYHRKRSAEFGDGMELVVIVPRSKIAPSLNLTLVEQAATIYREFDEENNVMIAYCFGSKQKHIDQLTERFSHLSIPVRPYQSGKFIALDSILERLPHSLDFDHNRDLGLGNNSGYIGEGDFNHQTDAAHHVELVDTITSILYGFFLCYGTFIGDNEAIHYASIDLPVVGSVGQYADLFGQIATHCANLGLQVRHHFEQTRYGQKSTRGVYDGELLEAFAQYAHDSRTIARADQTTYETPRLVSFLSDSSYNPDQIKALESGDVVVKFSRR